MAGSGEDRINSSVIRPFTSSILVMVTKNVSGTPDFNLTLTRLIAREDCSTFLRHERCKSFLPYIGACACFRPFLSQFYLIGFHKCACLPRHQDITPRSTDGDVRTENNGGIILNCVFNTKQGDSGSFSSRQGPVSGLVNTLNFQNMRLSAFPRLRFTECHLLHTEITTIQTNKQTPLPLVRERTIPTERPPPVDEI
jgi:hypothetical protein